MRGLRQGLGEDERYRIADDVVHQLQEYGDPWELSRELPQATAKGHCTQPLIDEH